MKLAHPDLMEILEWDSPWPASLIIESPQLFLRTVGELTEQCEGGEGNFVCSIGQKDLEFHKKAMIIRDLWSVDVNQKKLMNGILQQLKSIALEEFYEETHELLQRLALWVTDLTQASMLDFDWEPEPDVTALLKAVDLKIEVSDDPFHRLLDYICLCQEFLHTQLVILVSLRSYLSEEEAAAFCREIGARGLHVLFIEAQQCQRIPGEKQLLVDRDLCELLLG